MNSVASLRRLAAATVTALLVAAAPAAAGETATASATANCPGADLVPTASNAAQINTATLCLANAERRANDRRPLVAKSALAKASRTYAKRMVRDEFFDHIAPDGSSPVNRIEKTGYLPEDGHWLVGENIGWGTEAQTTPRSMMQAWMASPGHRENLLRPSFRNLGVGIALGAPSADTGDEAAVTYVTEFGVRSGS